MRLLLIEDNPDDVAVVKRLARQSAEPIEVAVANTGSHALRWLITRTGQPDLILLDIGLPGLSGTNVLRQIKAQARLRDVPVIVLSGSDNDDDVLEGMRLGAHSHMVKPINQTDFNWIVGSVRRAGPRLHALRVLQERW
jgi:DNA-binding response OmpR family regulator